MRWRLPLMALAGLSLLGALWGGLVRLGWPLPLPAPEILPGHGPLMVTGFLGTLIGLERAVALRQRWAYGAPILAGVGGLSILGGAPVHAGHGLAAAGGAFLIAIFIHLYREHPAVHLATMGSGAALWLVGTLLSHIGLPVHRVVPWWVGFLVLTIAGERLGLSRLVPRSSWSRAGFLLATGVFLLGLVAGLVAFDVGIRAAGLGLLALAVWLLGHDLAWRALRQPGLPRFMAVALLSGHFWLGAGGLLWLLFGERFAAGFHYDAMLHAVFVGFVLSMIFAHAPIIFPSIVGVGMPFQRAFYVHLALLHVSLLVRVGGDLAASVPGQRWGGLGNALAVLLFLANNARAVRLGEKE